MAGEPVFSPREIKIEIPATAITCPYCKSLSHFTDTGRSIFMDKKGVWSILLCDNCKGPILAIYKWTGSYGMEPGSEAGIPSLETKPVKTYPEMMPSVHESIPKGIGEDYRESQICFNAEAWKAAVVLCRRALQNSVVEKGADINKKLQHQIDELAEKGVITHDIRDWAHTIRHLGNDGAHPYDRGQLTGVTKDDAGQTLKFMESYLQYVYVMPYEVSRKRKP